VRETLSTLLWPLLPERALAFEISSDWTLQACQYLPCTAMGGGAAGLSNYVLDRIVLGMEIGFIALGLIALFLTAMNMVIFGDQEDVVKTSRMQFVYAIAAAGVVSFARWIAEAFAPQFVGGELVNMTIANTLAGNVITLFRISLSLLIVVNIVLQGTRLITSQGEEDQRGKAQKRLIATFIGAAFVLLANTIAVSVMPGAAGSTTLAVEFAGITNYLITIVGFGSVIVIIVAGATLVLSVDESFKDKAKAMVKTAIVALAAVIVSYSLVNAFIFLNPS
jgi:hypothetical protein